MRTSIFLQLWDWHEKTKQNKAWVFWSSSNPQIWPQARSIIVHCRYRHIRRFTDRHPPLCQEQGLTGWLSQHVIRVFQAFHCPSFMLADSESERSRDWMVVWIYHGLAFFFLHWLLTSSHWTLRLQHCCTLAFGLQQSLTSVVILMVVPSIAFKYIFWTDTHEWPKFELCDEFAYQMWYHQ